MHPYKLDLIIYITKGYQKKGSCLSGIKSIYREVHEILIKSRLINSINTANQKYTEKIRYYATEHKQAENKINS